jgi:hypothetical protein
MTIDERTEVDEIIATRRQSRGAVPPVKWVLCKLERRYLPPPTSQGRGIDTRRGRPGRALDRDPKTTRRHQPSVCRRGPSVDYSIGAA